jgi:hypothetical protein
MILQIDNVFLFILWLVIALVMIYLVLFISVIIGESKERAKEKTLMIVILGLIILFAIPFLRSIFSLVLNFLGEGLASIRNFIDGGGQNYLGALVPILLFLVILVLVKYMLTVEWDNAIWISLIMLFILYVMYSLFPEIYTFLQVG